MTVETISSAQANFYKLVDQVLETGEPVTIQRNGRSVLLVANLDSSKLARIRAIPNLVVGSSNDLPNVRWDKECKPFL